MRLTAILVLLGPAVGSGLFFHALLTQVAS